MTNENIKRAIPTPPGGGSWTFDEAEWKWISNDPAPEDTPATDAAPAADEPAAQAASEE
jgi:hypothetical protein